jgi:hypothetical protein
MSVATRSKLRLKQIKIRKWVLLPQAISELNIFESITREGITGNIVINDWQALRELGYIFAGDDITLEFASEDRAELVLKMKIYATMDNQQISEQTYNTSNFMFCSPWLVDGMTRQISKPYKDKFIHEIIKDLLEECGAKIGYIEPTKQKLENFVTPLWTAVRSIRHLLTYAINQQGVGGYVIWTNLEEDKVYCTTLDYIYKGQIGFMESKFTEMPGNPQYEGAVKFAHLEQNWDILQFVNVGMAKTRNYGFWFDKKEVVETKDDITAWGKKVKHLAKKFPVDKKYLDKKYWTNCFCSLYPKKGDAVTSQDEVNDYIQGEQYSRYAHMTADTFKINIETVGHSERRVGMLVELDIQSQNEPETRQGNLQFKGMFVIRDIRHVINATTGDYDQYVSLAVDGYYKFERDELIKW